MRVEIEATNSAMSEPVLVDLTAAEVIHAALIGALRHNNAAVNDRKDAVAEPGELNSSLARHVNGAGAEIAVAKLMGLYWGGHLDRFKGPDLGKATQVRSRTLDRHDLIVRDADNSDHFYVLVTGVGPEFKVWGWIKGVDAKQDKYRDNPGGLGRCYLIPKADLHPMINGGALA